MNKVLVTGANRGIGLEVCRQLAERGDEVIAVCRRGSADLGALDLKLIEGIDVAADEPVSRLRELTGLQSLDWVINNAGVLAGDSLDRLDFDAMAWQFRVNTLGPLRVTSALLPLLTRGSKIGIITSRMGSIADNTSGGYYGYRVSKAAVNMVGMCLARDLQSRGIAVALLHPGMVATDMTDGQGVPVQQSAAGLIKRMDALDMAHTGGFWHAEGEVLPW